MDDNEKITVETMPLTDDQMLDQQLAIAMDIAREAHGKLKGLGHVVRELSRDLEPLILRLETMQEARKK